jgi:creatinine amidohydrolase
MQKHRLADLTFIEFRERAADDPVILIPLGSQEEQGPHAPMGDYQLTEAVADRIARAAGCITAPIMPFGYADYFRPVPGGIALRPETFAAVLEDILGNFLDHGLERLVILNGHSGNYPLIDQVIRKLKRERGVILPCLNLWRLMPAEVMREIYGEDIARRTGHGGEPLSSIYLHLLPDLMRPDLITAEDAKGELLGLPTAGLAAVRFRGVDVNVPLDIDERCGNGIASGDPAPASAEVGEKAVAWLVEFCAAFVRHMETVDVRHRRTQPSKGAEE